MARLNRALARDTSLWADDVWMVDSNPRGMRPVSGRRPPQRLGRMRPVRHCASHSRYFYGLRLHLLWTLHGLPVGFALASAGLMSGRRCWPSSTTRSWPPCCPARC